MTNASATISAISSTSRPSAGGWLFSRFLVQILPLARARAAVGEVQVADQFFVHLGQPQAWCAPGVAQVAVAVLFVRLGSLGERKGQ